jgi:RNA-binding protein YlmH
VKLYQHFREEEQPFIDQVLEWKQIVTLQYTIKRSDFLDPREQEIVKLVVGNDPEVNLLFNGGNDNAERKRVVLYPEFIVPTEEDLGLTLFEIQYPQKFVTIEHRDVLGSLMSLGLKREKYGDIYVNDGKIQVIVATEIADYVSMNLQTIGKTSISCEKKPISSVFTFKNEWEERVGTVASLRLDAVLSEVYRTSRSKVTPYIKNGLVKVNWKPIEQTSYECKEGDTFSVRGLGRAKLLSIEGKTKKDNCRIVSGIQKN